MIRFQAVENRANFYTRDQQVRGMKGDPGDPGVSVSDATLDAEGHLIITLSDGTVIDAGMAQGEPGEPGQDGDDGISPTVTVTAITGGYSITITDASGDHAFALYNGDDGTDGVSPTVSVTPVTDGYSVTITDATGDHTFALYNGEDGADGEDGTDGEDGVSPEVSVSTITGGHSVTITDATGVHTFNVMDGEDGRDGVGIPAGGSAGQVLKKQSGTDYDVAWESGGSSSADWSDITNKPTTISGYGITNAYTKTEVDGLIPTVPTDLSELSDDSTHRLVADTEKAAWDAKGSYSKPSGGIPDTDLSSAVQASLALADSAVQTESDPTVPSWAKQSTKPSYEWSEISNTPNVDDMFYCTYGTTTSAQIDAAISAGKVPVCVYQSQRYSYVGLSNGYHCFTLVLSDSVKRLYVKTSWGNATYTVAKSTDIPTVPTNVSAFTNDAGYLTSHQSLSAYRTASAQDTIDSGKLSTSHASDASAHSSLFAAKVDVAQGSPHAGEFLVVGSNGNVTTQAFSVLAGGSY